MHRCLQCSGSFKPFTVKTEIQGGAKKDNYKILQYLFIYLFNLFVYLFVCLSIYLFIYLFMTFAAVFADRRHSNKTGSLTRLVSSSSQQKATALHVTRGLTNFAK